MLLAREENKIGDIGIMKKKVFALILTVCLVLNMMPAMNFASVVQTGFNTSVGSTDYLVGSSPVVVDSGLTLNFTENIKGATVSITNFKTGDTLLYPAQIGSIIGSEYNADNGVLTLMGLDTPENYQLALRSIKFSTTSNDNTDRNIDISIGNGLYLAATGHFYEFVNTGDPVTWSTAKADSELKSLFGRKGYLVTLTSQDENNFVQLKALGIGWIGARDYGRDLTTGVTTGTYGDWRWVTGPEGATIGEKEGKPFWSGYQDGEAVEDMYVNWDRDVDKEPNNYSIGSAGEWVAHIYKTTGKWNDFNPYDPGVNGYIVEYGGMSGDTPVKITGTKIIKIIPASTQARWGVAGVSDSAPSSWLYGTLAEAVSYVSDLASGTAYIQVLSDVTTATALHFDLEDKTTILDLNGKTITRSTSGEENSPVINITSGILKVDDTSDSKLGSILSTVAGNDTSGIKIVGGTVNFYNGRVLAPGQAIYLESGTFNMYDGQLIGLWNNVNNAVNEAIVVNSGVINIYGGYLTGNKAFWGDPAVGKVTGNVYGGYYSDDSISGFLDTKYAVGNISTNITIPSITAGGITYGPYTLSKEVYKIVTTVSSVAVPSNGTYKVGNNLSFTVNFSDAITVDTTVGTPYIQLTLDTGGTVNAAYQSGSGTTALIFRYIVVSGNYDMDGIVVGSAITLNGGTLKDGAENNVALTLNAVDSTVGVKVNGVAPTVSSLSPADSSTNVAMDSNLVITFSENVAKGSGNIVIKRAVDHSVIESINVTSSQVTGGGTAIITVNPSVTLLAETEYYVQIDATAFANSVGNAYAGIADQTTWNFTTQRITSSTPTTSPTTVNVIVNGVTQNAGTESKSIEEGKSTVTVNLNNSAIESKINEVAKNPPTVGNNIIQVTVSDTNSEVSKVELTGDIVKKLEVNDFDVSIKRDHVEYIIPAEEFTINQVASNLGVSENALKDIKIEVQITKIDQSVISKYNEVAKNNGSELVFSPVAFDVIAKIVKSDGTVEKVEINKFSNYVERVIEIPAGVDPKKATTGIVFNSNGTYSHVPTEVFSKDGKWYARLNSMTNSEYSIIWNPIIVESVENHWSKEAVNDLASRLVIFSPEKFEPNKAITRADFAEYIVRALGLYREGSSHENKFKDVFVNGQRTLAILIANENGIVTGYQDGTFRPNALITREEAMTMYQRAMMVIRLVGSDTERYKNYSDFDQVSNWATPYVKDVLSAHVFNGSTATSISPKANMTYGEAAQAIRNLLVESKLINK
ncbi:MAG: hypothetical protein BGO41_11530 [Clostridiales bacterium 38-18]|nr:MAG: hypothetical protein BGO41_11530 [Clostridiales bacterium 38-18]